MFCQKHYIHVVNIHKMFSQKWSENVNFHSLFRFSQKKQERNDNEDQCAEEGDWLWGNGTNLTETQNTQ